ncbi:hypothetical protein OAO01_02385 [Oligoflexia bacterium]|nr:hypothetical protein [Oligoflexia bacterium]
MTEKKPPAKRNKKSDNSAEFGAVATKADLKGFLLNIRDRMTEEIAAPIYASSAMNHILTLPNIYDVLDEENKEIARDIWLRLKQAGIQIKTPPMLFGAEEEVL